MKATKMAWVAVIGSMMTGTLAVGCTNTVEDNALKGQTPIVGGACEAEGAVETCGANNDGELTCEKQKNGSLAWSSCVVGNKVVDQCALGQTQACTIKVMDGAGGSSGGTVDMPGTQSCEAGSNGQLVWGACASSSASTPLVFSFDGAPATFAEAPGAFSLNPTMSVATDWVTAATPWLALDRNHDGAIADGGELFGSATSLSSGGFAKNGFEALAELDSNHDGRIDRDDAAFSSLVVWADANQNRVSDAGEMVSLSAKGIESIELAFSNRTSCDLRGNCEIESARFTFRDPSGREHTGRIADVHLAHR